MAVAKMQWAQKKGFNLDQKPTFVSACNRECSKPNSGSKNATATASCSSRLLTHTRWQTSDMSGANPFHSFATKMRLNWRLGADSVPC